ncbi:MAG: glycoside hydrolase, partial [Sphingobacteriales bacterium]
MKNIILRFSGLVTVWLLAASTNCSAQSKALYLGSPDHQNRISLSLDNAGALSYKVTRANKIIIQSSPLGLVRNDQDFTSGLAVATVSAIENSRERYELKVANNKTVDHVLSKKSITFKNKKGALLILDLAAGQEGVAFRYRFNGDDKQTHTIKKELTGFHIETGAKGWLQPYNKAGKYTPGYEDFYVNVNSGDPINGARNESVGWCMPALFNVNGKKNWVLIAESGTDGAYPGCHLQPDSKGGLYSIAFAKADEKYTLPLPVKENAYP